MSLVSMLSLVSACSVATTGETPVPEVDATYVRAAEVLCPVMWDWQKNVGATMNEMSQEARNEIDADARQTLYLRAFDRVRELNAQLEATVVSLGDTEPLDRILPDVRDGITTSNTILQGTQSTVEDRHRMTFPPSYDEMVPTIFMDVEKAIDVAKPEMASYGDPELIDAFITVPQCQHGVKDANDGIPRYVP